MQSPNTRLTPLGFRFAMRDARLTFAHPRSTYPVFRFATRAATFTGRGIRFMVGRMIGVLSVDVN